MSAPEDAPFDAGRITFNSEVMGGKPCIRGMRVTVGMVVGLVAAGKSTKEIVESFPYLEEEEDVPAGAQVRRLEDAGARRPPHRPEMKLLLDMNLPPAWCTVLRQDGHDAWH